ncbi:CpsD/CapB family tyrosine-protein kinase [Isoptericola sp. 4D.3]|uniref:CpsD/CapB family tyrosine-protein kinase n=1 Tax=Isoptericola peretonis TaxID=2918523 RepID=A0ABT0J5S8_9MICO|nr:CpsD/CapB family tyrosine-protein kinase [Isoptericola sp. 4D.3]
MTVREFFKTVWDGKYLVLVVLLVVLAAAYAYLGRQEAVYEATATVQLREADAAPDFESVVMTADSDPDIATSPEVEDAAAGSLGVDAAGLSVTAAAGPEASTVVLTARGASEEHAITITNAFAAAYVQHLPAVLDGQLEEIDDRLERLRDRHSAVNTRANRNDALAQTELTTIEGQYQVLVAEQQMLDSIRASEAVALVAKPATSAVSLGVPPATVMALGLLAGLLAGVGVAFARRGLDFRVRGASQAGELTGLPVLAELSGVKHSLKDAHATGSLPISSRTASPFTESIRELRTALHVALPEGEPAIVLVTATDPAAPRSFIAANLAASWALSGRRTAILQADMRRPELAALLPPPAGWDGDLQMPRPTRVPYLELVPVPHVAMDPADYLATDDARALVDGLRERAEIVVIDAPPVLAAADATILGGYADAAVLLATVGKTDRVVLTESADRLSGNNVPLAGIALSGVTSDRRTRYASVYDAAGGASGEQDMMAQGESAAPGASATPGSAGTVRRPEEPTPATKDGPGGHDVATATVRLPAVVAARAAAPARGPHWPRVTSTAQSGGTVALGSEPTDRGGRDRGTTDQ